MRKDPRKQLQYMELPWEIYSRASSVYWDVKCQLLTLNEALDSNKVTMSEYKSYLTERKKYMRE